MSINLKRFLKAAANKVISFEPILDGLRKSRLSQKIVVLMYHEVAEEAKDIESWTVVKRDAFIRQMEYLARHFDVISLEEALARMSCNSAGRGKPSAVITFDDGYKGNHRVLLPIVTSMDLPVTVFVASSAVQNGRKYWYDRIICAFQDNTPYALNLRRLSLGEYRINMCRGAGNWAEIERLLRDLKKLMPQAREVAVESILDELKPAAGAQSALLAPMTVTEVRELSESPLVTIGAHSHCHNILTQLPSDQVRESIRVSRELLEEWTGRKVRYFSYPNGNYNDTTVAILKELGFECSLTTVPGPWTAEHSVFSIPRMGIGRYDSIESFKVVVSGM